MTLPAAAPILHLAEVDSTNAEAMRRAAAGETGPLWISADVQTSGRGRSGRSWASQSGNLHASLLLRLATPQPKAYQLSLVAGVAVEEAVRTAMDPAPEHLRLKWPNDLLIGRAKAGGILVESTAGSSVLVAAIGIGINIVSHPGDIDRPVTHLAAHGTAPSRGDLESRLAASLARWLAAWDEGAGFGAVRKAWLARAHPVGEQVSVTIGDGPRRGTFTGLDDEGALLMKDAEGREHRVTYGDVTLV